MATDATRIRVAQLARVFLAPVGTTAPADEVAALASGWVDVGYFTPDSLNWATDPTFETVASHQSNYPTRRFQTADAATVEVDLQEWSGANFKAVYGGGTLTEVTTGHFKFSPPAIGGRSETAVILEIIDGTLKYRRVIPKAQQVEGASQTFNKTSESILPLRLSVLGSDVGDPWYDLNNDPTFDPSP